MALFSLMLYYGKSSKSIPDKSVRHDYNNITTQAYRSRYYIVLNSSYYYIILKSDNYLAVLDDYHIIANQLDVK